MYFQSCIRQSVVLLLHVHPHTSSHTHTHTHTPFSIPSQERDLLANPTYGDITELMRLEEVCHNHQTSGGCVKVGIWGGGDGDPSFVLTGICCWQ